MCYFVLKYDSHLIFFKFIQTVCLIRHSIQLFKFLSFQLQLRAIYFEYQDLTDSFFTALALFSFSHYSFLTNEANSIVFILSFANCFHFSCFLFLIILSIQFFNAIDFSFISKVFNFIIIFSYIFYFLTLTFKYSFRHCLS